MKKQAKNKQSAVELPPELGAALQRHSSTTRKMIAVMAEGLIKALSLEGLVYILGDEINSTCSKVHEALYREFYKKGVSFFEVYSLFNLASHVGKFTLPSSGIYPPNDVSPLHGLLVSLVIEQTIIPTPELESKASREILLPAGTKGYINLRKVPWKVKGISPSTFPVSVEFRYQDMQIAAYVRWESIKPAQWEGEQEEWQFEDGSVQ